ncbi:CBS domain-containing protein [Kineosporia rhizophila]|uniref:magnesium transporter MgtE N-terminal domain-containing protein n=1 Tax=Kineosporia TaxID=49184 RepID=UPI001E36D095|nr:CBS domain-containing protein [Kineosporia sp. NBRC 101677]MCE0534940.1 CBS domain-containing protein [Kineosporia rhizophila]GLY14779.1 magnesium transporter [Kineosporia sp. NBRC 101677]
MSAAANRVFVARMAGLAVFDPLGDQVGRVRDVIVMFRPGKPTRVVGLVVEVVGRRRVFLPMTRVTNIDAGQVITTGLVNMRRFEQRPTETLVLGELLDRTVTFREDGGQVTIEDVAMQANRAKEWRLCRAYVRRVRQGRFARKGEAFVVDIDALEGFGIVEERQGAANLLAAFDGLKAADLAEVIHELAPKRRHEVASALTDDRLADVLEELPEEVQVELLTELESGRAADVLEAMQPDDAADLLSELPLDQRDQLLELMEPDEAEDVRRLLAYGDDTAGGLMTPEPVVLPPDAAIAEALARVRRAELSSALAAAVFVCRPPLETPTGKFLGMVHIQRMLREPPSQLLGRIVDKDVKSLPADATLEQVARHLAHYNLVSVPVTDAQGRLIGAVTVDDVLDHLLPDHWREDPADLRDVGMTGEIPRVG